MANWKSDNDEESGDNWVTWLVSSIKWNKQAIHHHPELKEINYLSHLFAKSELISEKILKITFSFKNQKKKSVINYTAVPEDINI